MSDQEFESLSETYLRQIRDSLHFIKIAAGIWLVLVALGIFAILCR